MPSLKGKNMPSGNWLALQKVNGSVHSIVLDYHNPKPRKQKLDSQKKARPQGKQGHDEGSRKRRKVEREEPTNRFSNLSITSEQARAPAAGPSAPHAPTTATWKNGESVASLQQMALGHVEYTSQQEL